MGKLAPAQKTLNFSRKPFAMTGSDEKSAAIPKKYFIDFSGENYNFEERSWHFQCWASIWIERRKIQIGAIPPPTPPSTHHPDPRIHSHHLQHPLIPSHKYTRLWLQNKQNKARANKLRNPQSMSAVDIFFGTIKRSQHSKGQEPLLLYLK